MAQPDPRKPPTPPPGHGGTPPGQAGKPPTTEPPPAGIQLPYTISVGVDSGVTITAINLSSTTISGPADNANTTVGTVTIATEPPDQQITTPVVLEGDAASKFTLTNQGHAPCELTVGASNLPAGDYNIILSVTPQA